MPMIAPVTMGPHRDVKKLLSPLSEDLPVFLAMSLSLSRAQAEYVYLGI